MAEVVKRTRECPNCHDMIQFERKDCKTALADELPSYVVYPYRGQKPMMCNEYYEIWYLRCPSCGEYVHVWTVNHKKP